MQLSSFRWTLIVAAVCLAMTCNANRRARRERFEASDATATTGESTIPSEGNESTLDIASWNIEWFGDTNNGPTDEIVQLQNVRAVVASADVDIWGFVEVVNWASWNSLKSQLPGYSGILADETAVVGGAEYYGNSEQKVGILYKTSVATVRDARLILTGYDADFAGRPPLQVTLRASLNGTTEDIIVVVIHAKCCTAAGDWQQRVNASNALKSYLDSALPSQKVWVIGDFNDDVDASTATGYASPYANFVDDPAHYAFTTMALSEAHLGSTVDYTDTIDHHLTTNDSYATYVAGSAEVMRVDRYIDNYATTTSDHYPVLSRYYWVTGADGANGQDDASAAGMTNGPNVIINEVCANEPGSDTAGEFVELVNVGSAPAEIGDWTLSDGTQIRHSFVPGTTLANGKAIVVFAGSSAIPSGLSNAVSASTGSLRLANGGDSLTLKNSGGVTIAAITYPASLANDDGVSMNLSPDGSASGTFMKHTSLSTLSESPGERIDGNDW